MKRKISILILVCLLFGNISVALAATSTANEAYTDVNPNDWYYKAVAYLHTQDLVNGTGPNQFSPNTEISRAMFVTILGRAAEQGGENINGFTCSFDDTEKGVWYSDYVAWAAAAGIITGYSERVFGTHDPVTRQDIATIMVRYADYKNIATPVRVAGRSFTDEDQISGYAQSSIRRFIDTGILNGYTDGSFRPQNAATRAEAATMLESLLFAGPMADWYTWLTYYPIYLYDEENETYSGYSFNFYSYYEVEIFNGNRSAHCRYTLSEDSITIVGSDPVTGMTISDVYAAEYGTKSIRLSGTGPLTGLLVTTLADRN